MTGSMTDSAELFLMDGTTAATYLVKHDMTVMRCDRLLSMFGRHDRFDELALFEAERDRYFNDVLKAQPRDRSADGIIKRGDTSSAQVRKPAHEGGARVWTIPFARSWPPPKFGTYQGAF